MRKSPSTPRNPKTATLPVRSHKPSSSPTRRAPCPIRPQEPPRAQERTEATILRGQRERQANPEKPFRMHGSAEKEPSLVSRSRKRAQQASPWFPVRPMDIAQCSWGIAPEGTTGSREGPSLRRYDNVNFPDSGCKPVVGVPVFASCRRDGRPRRLVWWQGVRV